MRNQFAVVDNPSGFRGLFQRVMFEGEDSGDVYAWLKKNSALDAPGYYVIDRLTSVRWEEGEFVREFEEQMKKANEATGHKCLSEDRIRTIVLEEMSKVLDATREKACVPEYYDTEKMEDALVAIVDHLSEKKAEEKVDTHEDRFHEGGYS